jgi:hypothetical protein
VGWRRPARSSTVDADREYSNLFNSL